MNKFWGRFLVVATTAVIFYATSWGVLAQTRAYRVSDRQVTDLLKNIETDTDNFRSVMSTALDNSSFNGTRTEDEIQGYVNDFETSTDALNRNFQSRRSAGSDVTDVLNRAANIDRFLQQYRLNNQVTTSWARVRSDLNTLSGYYNVTYNANQNNYPANNNPNNNYPTSNYPNGNQTNNYPNGNQLPNDRLPRSSRVALNRLTGTYRLDASRSTDVQAEITRAVAGLNVNQRDRITRQATRRLEAPEELAIDRTGKNVTIASTKSPRVTFTADGQTNTEQMPNGRSMTVNANIVGEQLVINYSGDRANDFYVAFNPVRGVGRNATDDLRVTRRIYLEGVNRQISVDSYYTKTSNVAELDNIFRGNSNDNGGYNNNGNNNNNNPNNNNNSGYTVPDGTQLTAVLQNNLDTRSSQENDRFTMEVTAPAQFDGAIIEGRVGKVQRSGRVTGRAQLELDFETIKLPSGQTYGFEGFIQSVRTANGDNVQIDNEGTVKEGSSQTTKTVGRTAIGAALGAIIGAVAGGGSGAAIGAGVGAGAGAGSVVLQGRDDLNLTTGSEITVTASAPRNQ